MITTTETRVQYTPSAPTNDFAFDIRYFEESDINVEVVDSQGVSTILTLNSVAGGFSVTAVNGNPENGATIDTTETYTIGDTVTIYREVPITQEAEFQRGGDLPPAVLNASLDRGVAISQQVESGVERALICPITDPDGLSYELPTVTLRKNRAVGFDDNGNVVPLDLADTGTLSVDTAKGLEINSNIISGKVDGSTMKFDNDGNFSVNTIETANINTDAITTDKIADSAVTFEKLEAIGLSKVIGNMSGVNEEVVVLDEDSMGSDSDTALATQQSIKTYVDTQVGAFGGISEYASTEQGIPNEDTDLVVTHGLGGTPKWSQVVLKCTTAEYGWSIGDEIIISNEHGDAGYTHSVWQNATELGYVRNTPYLYIANRAGAGQVDITEANWRLVFRAWK